MGGSGDSGGGGGLGPGELIGVVLAGIIGVGACSFIISKAVAGGSTMTTTDGSDHTAGSRAAV